MQEVSPGGVLQVYYFPFIHTMSSLASHKSSFPERPPATDPTHSWDRDLAPLSGAFPSKPGLLTVTLYSQSPFQRAKCHKEKWWSRVFPGLRRHCGMISRQVDTLTVHFLFHTIYLPVPGFFGWFSGCLVKLQEDTLCVGFEYCSQHSPSLHWYTAWFYVLA